MLARVPGDAKPHLVFSPTLLPSIDEEAGVTGRGSPASYFDTGRNHEPCSDQLGRLGARQPWSNPAIATVLAAAFAPAQAPVLAVVATCRRTAGAQRPRSLPARAACGGGLAGAMAGGSPGRPRLPSTLVMAEGSRIARAVCAGRRSACRPGRRQGRRGAAARPNGSSAGSGCRAVTGSGGGVGLAIVRLRLRRVVLGLCAVAARPVVGHGLRHDAIAQAGGRVENAVVGDPLPARPAGSARRVSRGRCGARSRRACCHRGSGD